MPAAQPQLRVPVPLELGQALLMFPQGLQQALRQGLTRAR